MDPVRAHSDCASGLPQEYSSDCPGNGSHTQSISESLYGGSTGTSRTSRTTASENICVSISNRPPCVIGSKVWNATGAVLPEVGDTLRDQRTNAAQSVRSRETAAFTFSALRPGTYQLQGIKAGYASSRWTDITISVAETVRVQPQLLLPTLAQRVEVRLDPLVVQTDSMTLGRLVNETAVSNLPLARRNFTQIVGLSPGVTSSVNNAGQLGLGGSGFSQIDNVSDGIFVHGGQRHCQLRDPDTQASRNSRFRRLYTRRPTDATRAPISSVARLQQPPLS
jgi:hypothetical protein